MDYGDNRHCFLLWPNLSKCYPLVILSGSTVGVTFPNIWPKNNINANGSNVAGLVGPLMGVWSPPCRYFVVDKKESGVALGEEAVRLVECVRGV